MSDGSAAPKPLLRMARYGTGDPLLLLVHGLGASGDDWAFQIPAFMPHFHVLVPDLPGSGRSPMAPREELSIEGFARAVWRQLDAAGIAHPHLLGFSLGGAVALEMALQRPHATGKLVLINSLPSYRVDHWRKWLEVNVQIGLVRLMGLPRVARMIGKRMFPHAHQAPMRARVEEVLGRHPVPPYLATARALAAWCADARLDQLRRETLLIAAEHDYTPLQEKREVAQRMGAKFAMIRGSRHGTPFDAIVASNACVLAFLRGEPMPAEDTLRIDAPHEAPTAAPELPPACELS